MMQLHRCSTLPTLFKHLPKAEMSEPCQMELEFLSEFQRGNMQVTKDTDGEYYIDSVFGDKNYHGCTTDGCSAYRIRIGDGATNAISYACYLETCGKYTALVHESECLAIWPEEFVQKHIEEGD